METICIKVEENLLTKINNSIKRFGYSTKTEFIREAIRKKLADEEKEVLIREFLAFKGKSKKKTSYKDNRITKEKASSELIAELEKRFR